YYFIRGGTYGYDVKFSEDLLKEKNDSELADCYGNLVSRVFALSKKYCQSLVPDVLSDETIVEFSLIHQIDELITSGQLSGALDLIIRQVQLINQWLTEKAPWKISCPVIEKEKITRCALEKIYVMTHLLLPFIPDACEKVLLRY